ncbi:ABC transporter permease [Herbaspirillum sp. YR522]|uniref:ABC transporter permease n=1 Tax=Herbaspirillum sp. YR522 TaxID=1144342 RepID=UPI00026F912D|nr:ABC transporter permease [Herbaspirillum sp. YR522]EJN02914.1 ABC-type dipeptide/oligopeptide/nickel transport system, permease component [Herbaspirillum sp. YR522]
MFEMMLKRALQSVLVIFVMSILAFVGINLVGDPIHLLVAPDASLEEIQRASHALGLDLPVYQQYLRFLGNALHGDMGNSFVFNRSAIALIFERMPATFELAIMALLLSAVFGIPLGLWSGLRPGTALHKFAMAFSIFGVTVPVFWLGLILILVFSVNLGWLPSGGRGETTSLLGIQVSFLTWDGIKFVILPACTLALHNVALVMRMTEAGTREVAVQEYVKFARAKGVGPLRLMVRHIMPNVMIPIVTVMGIEFGHLIAFSLITETIFAWPGMGKLIIDSVLQLDRPVVVAYLMVVLLLYVIINFTVDMLYLVLDPRLRTKAA